MLKIGSSAHITKVLEKRYTYRHCSFTLSVIFIFKSTSWQLIRLIKDKTKNMKKSKSGKNDNLSTPSIQNFFKNAPKKLLETGTNGKSIESDDVTKAVYTEALKKKLQELDENDEDATVVQQVIQNDVEQDGGSAQVMEKEIVAEIVATSQCTGCKDWEAKYKSLKKNYMKLGTNFAELRLKYDDLLGTKTYTNPSDINDPVSSNDTIFTSSELAVLQSMALDQKTDSTFILKCLNFAYKHNLSVLHHKTLKGKPESMIISDDGDVVCMPGKDPLSAEKVKRIRELFVERIDKCQLKPAANEERIKDSYMNKLIASGITNIGKKKIKDVDE